LNKISLKWEDALNWEYYNQLIDKLSPIHSYLWILYNSSSANLEKSISLGVLAFFTPSQIVINIFLAGIIVYRLIKGYNWIVFAITLSTVRFISLIGGDVFLPLLEPFSYNFLIGMTNLMIGPFLLVFLLLFYKGNTNKKSYWLCSLTILVMFSLFKDPLSASLLHVFIREASLDSDLVVIGIYNFILIVPTLLPFLIVYAFEIDAKIIKNSRLKNALKMIIGMLIILISINQIILYWP
jgi:hypothetical protein